MTATPPTVRSSTPWGTADYVRELAPGIIRVETPSHGGIWLAPDRLEVVHPDWRAYAAEWSKGWGDAWFEEDCAALAVLATFDELAPLFNITPAQASEQLAHWITPRPAQEARA